MQFPQSILVQPAKKPFKTTFLYMSVMKTNLKNAKSQFQQTKFLLKIQKLNLKMLKLKKPRKDLRKFSWIDAQKKALSRYP